MSMSFASMRSLELVDDKIVFRSNDSVIEIISQAYVDIIKYTVGVQNSLFAPISVSLPEDVRFMINDDFFVFETSSPICDRYLSLSMTVTTESEREKVANFCLIILYTKDTFDFTYLITSCPTPYALAEAIILDQQIRTISFSSVTFSQFAEYLKVICSQNRYISKIDFNCIIFECEQNELINLFKISIASPITKLYFNDCELFSDKFTKLLTNFANFQCQIEQISAINCSFSMNALESLMHFVFRTQNFRKLREFILTGECLPANVQDLMIELATSSDTIFPEDFATLQINSTKFNASQIIEAFAVCKTPVLVLDVSRSNLKSEFSEQIFAFSRIRELNISNVWATAEALISLFTAISTSSRNISVLIADHIHMTDANFGQFYSVAKNLNYPSIRVFSWENNNIKNEEFLWDFFRMLKNMRNVIDLSVSNTLNVSFQSSKLMADYLEVAHLQRFIMRGYDKSSFKEMFIPILKALSMHDSIKALDVTGQGFGDKGLIIINEMLKMNLTSLAFDEQYPLNCDHLFTTLDLILEDKMEFALWPYENLKRLWAKVSSQQFQELLPVVSSIRKRYLDRYRSIIKNCENARNSFFECSQIPRDPLLNNYKPTQKVDIDILNQVTVNMMQSIIDVKGEFNEDFLTIDIKRMIKKYMLNLLV
ncbi:hypothetical protein TVAG_028430 [Trichomonas vaginalis G3]|uniref:Leucine Rich Repeat family protein n=1 Tax=Trichomonas vaginalis (strain ATCC PRA-98 / G3) TaxID=412133 RepID=A2E090_TRIV3|nr:leucine-rich repeat, isoform f-related family [Trichomonas vaginalis G3]EAY13890.1 hypothetical protein TVAG_028430 [Trichomonas vaginalis G3]KAI5520926.1 leucine-rich repeat, isoform f-related family [Trichomonas vaginalis G3]|eukprot:XP_001326113.1 hypothetical protein [Trichomonas vaginalis G3]